MRVWPLQVTPNPTPSHMPTAEDLLDALPIYSPRAMPIIPQPSDYPDWEDTYGWA